MLAINRSTTGTTSSSSSRSGSSTTNSVTAHAHDGVTGPNLQGHTLRHLNQHLIALK